jgi:hypothetical protein
MLNGKCVKGIHKTQQKAQQHTTKYLLFFPEVTLCVVSKEMKSISLLSDAIGRFKKMLL